MQLWATPWLIKNSQKSYLPKRHTHTHIYTYIYTYIYMYIYIFIAHLYRPTHKPVVSKKSHIFHIVISTTYIDCLYQLLISTTYVLSFLGTKTNSIINSKSATTAFHFSRLHDHKAKQTKGSQYELSQHEQRTINFSAYSMTTRQGRWNDCVAIFVSAKYDVWLPHLLLIFKSTKAEMTRERYPHVSDKTQDVKEV